jgi:hypothetical protein
MRKIYSLFIFTIIVSIVQPTDGRILSNNRPIVSNVIASISTYGIYITYNVADAENEAMAVYIRVSSDSGKTYSVKPDSIYGQAGYPIYSGNNKSIYIKMPVIQNVFYRVTVIADDMQVTDLAEVANQVDSLRIRNDMYMIQGPRQWQTAFQHLENMKDTIQRRFNNKSLASWRNYFSYMTYIGANIIGRQTGILNDSNTYILGGHFDTIAGTPGADDNASGTIGMLEAMRVLTQYNFDYSINFIGFDLEETPGLYGSGKYVATGIPAYQLTKGMINLEMIGYYCDVANCQTVPSNFCTLFPSVCDSLTSRQYKGNFIFNVANENSNNIKSVYDSCAKVVVPEFSVLSFAVTGNGGTLPDVRRSDHAKFWDAGYKAIMLSNLYNYRNPYYHTYRDTVGTLNIGRMTKVIKAATAAIARLAGIRHSGFGFSNYVSTNITFVNYENNNLPERFHLYDNYPNPFNPSTKIKFDIPQFVILTPSSRGKNPFVTLKIYDILGKEVTILVDEQLKAGSYEVEFDGSNFSNGVYFYCITIHSDKLAAGSYIETKKMMLMK